MLWETGALGDGCPERLVPWETAGVTAPARATWAVVVPVKRLAGAKSRLGTFGDATREQLALAFAQDVVRTALASPLVQKVLVVTDDARAGTALAELGAQVCPDVPDAGLNAALAHGAALLRNRDPRLGVATVSADLPAARTDDLTRLLLAVTSRAFVADASGAGTTVLAASAGHALAPAYGPGSRGLHLASGAIERPGAPGLRRDVDTPTDLHAALELGVGPFTAAVAATVAGVRSPRRGTMRR